ncbi:MAG: undecaprenyl-diphosphate phosphatase [Holophagales bacterium]|nr:undecaprenyl-diphosphate phosphatase [Holophagales bacterium]
MTWLQALFLGLIQGITEFLPISSSAHLVVAPYLLGWTDQGLVFDIVANSGTLAAVLFFFRRELLEMVRHPLAGFSGPSPAPRSPADSREGVGEGAADPSEPYPAAELADSPLPDPSPAGSAGDGGRKIPLLPALLVGAVPTMVCGVVFYPWISGDGRDPLVVAVASIAFGLLLLWADRAGSRHRVLAQLGWKDVLWVGAAQALALVPGTSRSGITITAALALGLRREDAARLSFLLSIPVGVAALAYDVWSLWNEGAGEVGWVALVVGFAVSAVSAFLVIGWLLEWLRRQDLMFFVVYRLLLGAILLGLIWLP